MTEGTKQLRQWIERQGLRQYEAAERIGLHEAHLSQILNGQRTPGLSIAIKIWEATGIRERAWKDNQVGDSVELVAATPGKRRIGKA